MISRENLLRDGANAAKGTRLSVRNYLGKLCIHGEWPLKRRQLRGEGIQK